MTAPGTTVEGWQKIDTAEAAALAGVAMKTIRRWAEEGLIESVRSPKGRLIGIDRKAFEAYLLKSRRGAHPHAEVV